MDWTLSWCKLDPTTEMPVEWPVSLLLHRVYHLASSVAKPQASRCHAPSSLPPNCQTKLPRGQMACRRLEATGCHETERHATKQTTSPVNPSSASWRRRPPYLPSRSAPRASRRGWTTRQQTRSPSRLGGPGGGQGPAARRTSHGGGDCRSDPRRDRAADISRSDGPLRVGEGRRPCTWSCGRRRRQAGRPVAVLGQRRLWASGLLVRMHRLAWQVAGCVPCARRRHDARPCRFPVVASAELETRLPPGEPAYSGASCARRRGRRPAATCGRW